MRGLHTSRSRSRPPPTSPLFPSPALFRSDRTRARVLRVRAFGTDDVRRARTVSSLDVARSRRPALANGPRSSHPPARSEEHTSELQSPCNLVCRLLLEKEQQQKPTTHRHY